jgi:hypothetical protein
MAGSPKYKVYDTRIAAQIARELRVVGKGWTTRIGVLRFQQIRAQADATRLAHEVNVRRAQRRAR